MTLETLRLLFDFGLVVLIWLVQLVIYPGFRYYSKENLTIWHRCYTMGISFVVIPLMFGQLITGGLQLFQEFDGYTMASILLIASLWVSTFTQFVPIHNKIAKEETTTILLNQLVQKNWLRTILWSVTFILTLWKTFNTGSV